MRSSFLANEVGRQIKRSFWPPTSSRASVPRRRYGVSCLPPVECFVSLDSAQTCTWAAWMTTRLELRFDVSWQHEEIIECPSLSSSVPSIVKGDAATASSGWSTLTATWRSWRTSRAKYTVAMRPDLVRARARSGGRALLAVRAVRLQSRATPPMLPRPRGTRTYDAPARATTIMIARGQGDLKRTARRRSDSQDAGSAAPRLARSFFKRMLARTPGSGAA
jgi:hypothetical protein